MGKIVIGFIGIIASLQAFTFNGFISGMSQKEVIIKAEQKDIPLTYQPVVSGTHFSWKRLTNYEKYNRLRYPTHLFRSSCWVSLYFTPNSKKLYRVSISWPINDFMPKHGKIGRKDLIKILTDVLTKKYGMPKRNFPHNYIELVNSLALGGSKKNWETKDGSIIVFSTNMGSVSLNYIDETLKDTKKQERKVKKRNLIIEVIEKEGNKL